MGKIRVLVVDDAVVVRKLVTDALSEDPDIEVAGVAANGRIALAKIAQVNPDVVTLDIEMPDMDGLETLAELRKLYPRLPVIMFSTLTERGARVTLDALALGAADYVTKPSNVGSVGEGMRRIRADLVPKIKSLCVAKVPHVLPAAAPGPVRPAADARRSVTRPARPGALPSRVDVVVIGVSTGGPNALAEVVPALPRDFSVPVLVVQHMPPIFTRLLGERLDKMCDLAVAEAEEGGVVEAGRVWIAPGDHHMRVRRSGTTVAVRLDQEPPENSCRPAVDVMFRSAVETYGPGVLAVVLTGMGQDGLRGCERIKEAGGAVVVQDKATSVVWGMPGFVAGAGLADSVLPVDRVAGEIMRRTAEGRRIGTDLAGAGRPASTGGTR